MSVDLYANELHRPLAEVETFSKYLGGSPANIAVGLAKLGQRVGLISRVGDDGHGEFLRRYLQEVGVDTRFVGTDPQFRTSLAFAAMFPPADSHLLFYRDPCADTQVQPDDIDPATLLDIRLFLVSATALAVSPCRETVLHCLQTRRRHGLLNVMDIDHRPMLWPSRQESLVYYNWAIGLCDVLIGNEAEVAFAVEAAGLQDAGATPPDPQDPEAVEAAAYSLLEGSASQVVVKLGPSGAATLTKDGRTFASGFRVDVVNTLGAGDGFAAGYCAGLLQDMPLERCLRQANAVGAIVVSRHGCAPAIPILAELQEFLAGEE